MPRRIWDVREQFVGINSPLPPHGKEVLNSGQAVPQVGQGHHVDPQELFSNVVMSRLFLRTPTFSHDGAPKMNQNKSKSGMKNEPVWGWYWSALRVLTETPGSPRPSRRGIPKTTSLELLF